MRCAAEGVAAVAEVVVLRGGGGLHARRLHRPPHGWRVAQRACVEARRACIPLAFVGICTCAFHHSMAGLDDMLPQLWPRFGLIRAGIGRVWKRGSAQCV